VGRGQAVSKRGSLFLSLILFLFLFWGILRKRKRMRKRTIGGTTPIGPAVLQGIGVDGLVGLGEQGEDGAD
jgi:hypothetical protein